MKILGSAGSPFVRKVRGIAAEKGIPVEYVVQRPNVPGSPVPQMNPLGKIPVLVLDDGNVVYDSAVIGDYLDGVKPEPRLVPADFSGRIAVKRYEALGYDEYSFWIDTGMSFERKKASLERFIADVMPAFET